MMFFVNDFVYVYIYKIICLKALYLNLRGLLRSKQDYSHTSTPLLRHPLCMSLYTNTRGQNSWYLFIKENPTMVIETDKSINK